MVCFLQSLFFFPISLSSYAPWLSLIILRTYKPSDFPKVLWIAAMPGFLLDLISNHPFGLFPVSYTLTALLLFRFRTYFSHDELLPFSLFTVIVSMLSHLLELFFFFLFDRRASLPGEWELLKVVYTGIADGAYALLFFGIPWYLIGKIPKIKEWLIMRYSIE
jgi:cell shape-determining protein MreD